MHGDDLLGAEPVGLRGACDRPARDVHELLRTEERERRTLGQADLLQQAAMLGASGAAPCREASSSATLKPRLCRVAR